MKLYLISQKANIGYDTFDSAVVAAPSVDVARNIDPCTWNDNRLVDWPEKDAEDSSPDQVSVVLIGQAKPGTKQGVVCASFNAG